MESGDSSPDSAPDSDRKTINRTEIRYRAGPYTRLLM